MTMPTMTLAQHIASLILSRLETEGCSDGIGTLSPDDCARLGEDISRQVSTVFSVTITDDEDFKFFMEMAASIPAAVRQARTWLPAHLDRSDYESDAEMWEDNMLPAAGLTDDVTQEPWEPCGHETQPVRYKAVVGNFIVWVVGWTVKH